ncbi:hypothetical protein [Nocardia sp. NPDC057227]
MTYSTLQTERILFHTCGLPCGWTMSASVVSETEPPDRIPRR